MTNTPGRTPTERELLLRSLRAVCDESPSVAMFTLGWMAAEQDLEHLRETVRAAEQWRLHELKRRAGLTQERFDVPSRLS